MLDLKVRGNRWIRACAVAIIAAARPVTADEAGREVPEPPVAEKRADAQVDRRLPPVYPGEEVSDGKKTIKVWSTSGPVPVNRPAAAPQPFDQNVQGTGPISVIVDERGRSRGDGRHDDRPRRDRERFAIEGEAR